MPLTLSGTNGVSGVDGSASTPSVRGGTSANNGVFYGTNTVSVATNGTTAVTVDSSQNVGIGTTTNFALDAVGSARALVVQSSSTATFSTAPNSTNSIVISNSDTTTGNSSQLSFAAITGASTSQFISSAINGIHGARVNGQYPSGILTFSTAAGSNTAPAERARIDSSGNLLVGVTSTFSAVSVTTTSTFSTAGSASWAGAFQNTNSLPVGVLVKYSTDVNGAGNSFLYCLGNATLRAEIRSNGGLANYSANNANLSDIRTKTDINDAPAYLNKICSIPVRTFKYIDQTHDDLNLGVIAQEVEIVAPELVDTDGFGEIPDDGVPLKAIYQTDLQYALMKCIQELSAKLDAAEARIAALEAK